jgi:hypothetical protein
MPDAAPATSAGAADSIALATGTTSRPSPAPATTRPGTSGQAPIGVPAVVAAISTPATPAVSSTAPVTGTTRPRLAARRPADGAVAKLPALNAIVTTLACNGVYPCPYCSQMARIRKNPWKPDPEQQLHQQAVCEPGSTERSRGQQRCHGRTVLLGHRHACHGRTTGDDAPPGPLRPVEAVSADQRSDDRQQAGREDYAANEVRWPSGGCPALGHQPCGRGDDQQRDRDVDEEDRPPLQSEQVGVDQQATREEAGGRRDACDGAVEAECGSPFLAVEHDPERGQHLGDHAGCCHPLDGTGGDELGRRGREPTRQAGRREPTTPTMNSRFRP